MDEPQKNRKLLHSSFDTEKFSPIVVVAAKHVAPSPSKLMEASMKAVKVEAVLRANKEAQKGGGACLGSHENGYSY